MPVITYTARDRGFLVSDHDAGTEYQIECHLQGFVPDHGPKGDVVETNEGAPEGWLHAYQKRWQVRSDIVLSSDVEIWEEFFSSVANGETFLVDFTGTIASPGTDHSVWLSSRKPSRTQLRGNHMLYSFTIQGVP